MCSGGCCGSGDGCCSNEGCRCCVYKDPVLMTAQALSIVAFLISWGWWVTGLLGVASFIMLQVSWCCKMSKCCLITAGVFAVLAGLGSWAVAIVAFIEYANAYYYDEDYYMTIGILAAIGGALWIAAAVCVFVFSCGKRISKYTNSNGKETSETAKERDEETPVVTVPVSAQQPVYTSTTQTPPRPPQAPAAITPPTPAVDFDEESWGSTEKSVIQTDKHSKTKPDGTVVDTEIKTTRHRDSTTSSVKTVRLSKTLPDGSTKEKTTVINTDANGAQTRQSNVNVIPVAKYEVMEA